MAINRDEIEKYIFDPSNPKKCLSYKLLLKIASNNDTATFFSPEFLQYFFGDTITNEKFEEELWDKPNNYNSLTSLEKIKLFEKTLSKQELKEHINKINLSTNRILKHNFIKNLTTLEHKIDIEREQVIEEHPMSLGRLLKTKESKTDKVYLSIISKNLDEELKLYMQENIMFSDTELPLYPYNQQENYNRNFILFSPNHLEILRTNILRASIIVTLEKNIDNFLKYKQSNIKPIFLKKIEDINLLLNVLEKDIKAEETKEKVIQEISFIDQIYIKNFYSIDEISLADLHDKKEIYIVGENGDGKTLLLQAITIALVGVKEGDVFDLTKTQEKYHITIEDNKNNSYSKESKPYEHLLAYGASRYNNCQIEEDKTGYLTLFNNHYNLKSPMAWLIYLDHIEKADKHNIVSVSEAKELLQRLLNSDIEIDISPNGVTFMEKGSKVSFDQLSAGYKGVVTIICDMIARLSEKQPYATQIQEFQGVVLIDEIELHLHPKWKYNFMQKLRETFPMIQFIVTTHSPTVILGADKNAVFYKIYKEDGKVNISNQIPNEGYTNNSLISSPLFDLETITSRGYTKKISSDDYINEKIHQSIAKKIKEEKNIDEEALLKLIDQELEKI